MLEINKPPGGLNRGFTVTLFALKLCEKKSSGNIRFKIFVMAFQARKLFGTFEKRVPGACQLIMSTIQQIFASVIVYNENWNSTDKQSDVSLEKVQKLKEKD